MLLKKPLTIVVSGFLYDRIAVFIYTLQKRITYNVKCTTTYDFFFKPTIQAAIFLASAFGTSG
jgi:hypothetical protein